MRSGRSRKEEAVSHGTGEKGTTHPKPGNLYCVHVKVVLVLDVHPACEL